MRKRTFPPALHGSTLISLVLAVLAIAVTASASVVGAEAEQDKAKVARKEALAKQRRIFFNDDTYELSRDDANTPEGFLKRRLKPLVGTHVDVISWSVLGPWADAPVYDSKVQPIYGDAHGGTSPHWPKITGNIKALIKGGRGPLQIVIDFAHGNGMEVFASVRMNDCHDSFIQGGVTDWKQERPELWVDRGDVPHDKDAHPLGLYVTAQDFSHEEVRDRKFEIIEEVCRRYDIDGIDLNFMRHPVFFSQTMRGEPASQEELEIMTALIRRIRRGADEEGLRRGRPILVAAIVPDSLRLAKNIGLDIETWTKEDLLDIIIPGLGYAPFSLPVAEFVRLARPYGVKVFPCINRKAPQKVPEDLVSDGFRGVATNWYAAGADGIFFWNLGTPLEGKSGDKLIEIRNRYYAALPELGDPEALEGKEKLFAVDDPVLSYYRHVSSRPPLPVELKLGTTARVEFVVSDTVGSVAHNERLEQLRLTIQLNGPAQHKELLLRLNGEELRGGGAVQNSENLQIDYLLTGLPVRQGVNILEALLKETASTAEIPVELSQVRLRVRYKP
jgi:hypothetical protein